MLKLAVNEMVAEWWKRCCL